MNKARRKAKKITQDASAGPVDPELLNLLAEPQIKDEGDTVLDNVPPLAKDKADPAVVGANNMINQAMQNAVGFGFPRDQARLERTARLSERFGQGRILGRILGLSESAEKSGTINYGGLRERSV